jgi:hypothetical protein
MRKRRENKKRDELLESQRGSIDNFFTTGSSSRNSLQLALVNVEEHQTENLGDNNFSQPENRVDSPNSGNSKS